LFPGLAVLHSESVESSRVSRNGLSHLSARVGTDDYTPWAEEVKKHFSGQVLIAKDLMEF
jgi:ribonuclease BN (tRNA processing enzyme)